MPDLESWNTPGVEPQHPWLYVFPDLRKQSALDFGIAELNASLAHYGWDGIRYDGHYSAGNMELVPIEIKLGRAHPDTRGMQQCMADLGLRRGFVVGLTQEPIALTRNISLVDLAGLAKALRITPRAR